MKEILVLTQVYSYIEVPEDTTEEMACKIAKEEVDRLNKGTVNVSAVDLDKFELRDKE